MSRAPRSEDFASGETRTPRSRADWVGKIAVGLALAEACEAEVQGLGHGRMAYLVDMIAAMDRATPGVLVDIRHTGSINRPARELFKDSTAHSGCALLAGSAATRMMANFFLTLNHGPIPIRMFTSEADAVDWLRAQLSTARYRRAKRNRTVHMGLVLQFRPRGSRDQVEADEVQGYRVWWDDANGIMRLDWVAGSACTLPKAQGILSAVAALGRGRVQLLVDIRQAGSIDRPARELFMDSQEYFESYALLAGSAATRMMANFFLGLNRGPIPVRMFTSEAEAVDWLRTQS